LFFRVAALLRCVAARRQKRKSKQQQKPHWNDGACIGVTGPQVGRTIQVGEVFFSTPNNGPQDEYVQNEARRSGGVFIASQASNSDDISATLCRETRLVSIV